MLRQIVKSTHPARKLHLPLLIAIAFLLVSVILTATSQAQVSVIPQQPQGRAIPLPRVEYYGTFRDFYRGEYVRSIKNYRDLLRKAYRDVDGPFLDSTIYLTMLGECFYHTGNYAEAVNSYESAIKIYISRSRWEPRTQIPQTISANNTAVSKARVNWYNSKRTTAYGVYPRTYSYLFGRLDNERVLNTGGAIQNPEARPVDITEALRCCALALQRRAEIKGATCKYDPLTADFVRSLSSQALSSANVVGTWKTVLAGIAYASNEDWKKAASHLKSGIQVAGKFDHPLTPIALHQLAKVSFGTGQYDEAMRLFLEASHSAAVWEQYDLIEHSMRWAGKSYLMANPGSVFKPFENAIVWAGRENAKFMQASLIVELAHNHADAGNNRDAMRLLSQAKRPMARNDISSSTVASRMWYVSALSKFQGGKGNAGMADFNRFLKQFQTNGSKWSYQLALADNLVVSSRINTRAADALYSRLLREPVAVDWQVDPMETMTYLVTPHREPLERWFEIAIGQRKVAKAINIAEAIRRHRFYSQLPLGGRLMAFRWMFEAPEEAVDEKVIKLRKAFAQRFSAYQKLSLQSTELQKSLAALPLHPEPLSPDSRKQKDILSKLATVSSAQETLLSGMALMRLPSEFSFPPKVDFETAQSTIDDKQLIIYCVGTKANFHVFLIAKGSYGHIGQIQPGVLRKGISLLLKDLGSVDRNAAVPVELLQGDQWKITSAKLLQVLLPNRSPKFWEDFEEVVIIPDDATWYLPWELLQVGDEGNRSSLNELVNIRYLPTFGLAVAPNTVERKFDKQAVVIGKMSSKDSPEKTLKAFERLKAGNPNAASFESKLNGPSNLLSCIFDQLIVWTENKDTPGYGMAPLQIDRGKPGSTLGNWMALPWRGPQHVIMPGFSSAAANGGRTRNYGDDLFITTMSLMAAGAKTILISRWRVGGSTSLDLTREFAAQLPQSSPPDAWRRAVKIVSETELDFEAESRIRNAQTDEPIKAAHPFFWSGYLLIDMGKLRTKPVKEKGK